jgi:hypothetical protein
MMRSASFSREGSSRTTRNSPLPGILVTVRGGEVVERWGEAGRTEGFNGGGD